MITSTNRWEKEREYRGEIVKRGKEIVRKLFITEEEEEGGVTKASLRNMIEFARTSSSFEEFKLRSLYLASRSIERAGSRDIVIFIRDLIRNVKDLYGKYSDLKDELSIVKDLLEAATMAFYARSQYLDRDLYG
jgi:hypothetical protein